MLEKCLDSYTAGTTHGRRSINLWTGLPVVLQSPAPCPHSKREPTKSSTGPSISNLSCCTPTTILGELLSDRRSGGWNPHVFFPTPHEVVEMMVQMTFSGGSNSNDGYEKDSSGETEDRLKTVLALSNVRSISIPA